MEANEYQRESRKTIVTFEDDELLFEKHLLNASVGLSCEAGEVLQEVQRSIFCGNNLNGHNLLIECGDVLWYLSYLLDVLGFTLEDCMKENINKTHTRYPERLAEYNKEG